MGISVIVVGKLLLKVAVGCLLSIQSFNTGWGQEMLFVNPRNNYPPLHMEKNPFEMRFS